ncbi:MAG: AAA family ATPase [Holophagales bacterium]|nr:AAA family ATPase [Holophagales bacterium]MYC11432.1 AAA family ATPase [Holophagales bacterium]
MKLKSVYVRFFKSFNYDYLRKTTSADPRRKPWEFIEDKWYPHVRVQLDERITPIVGENESGKSCFLEAVECAITGIGIEHGDFCRHSRFFAVEAGRVHLPQFGCEWGDLTEEEANRVANLCGLGEDHESPSRFWLFRTGEGQATAFLSDEEGSPSSAVTDDQLSGMLPSVFHLNASLALPEAVPIGYLAGDRSQSGEYSNWPARSGGIALVEDALSKRPELFVDEGTIQQNASQIQALARAVRQTQQPDGQVKAAELELAHDLMLKIAGIDAGVLKRLRRALLEKQDAYAQGIVQAINAQLERRLNFRRFWAQDEAFELAVSARNHELVFMVRDRTNREYSVRERSDGLRYFLSYYIQHLAHDSPSDGGEEVLLMDEPDAYLSRQGQQDLLKILEEFAFPRRENRKSVQVVYVTHSPFLLDKNSTERIRVLEKGSDDQGTRVVRNASRNHYEPLRSAFGAFVAETTFIGNCNLMVEGLADQVLLAGAARHLWSKGVSKSKTLDLNEITIVQTGGAQEIPYFVYLARGRDIDRPLVLVLLDSDDEGDKAKDVLLKGIAVHKRRKPLLREGHILQIGDTCDHAVRIEDMVPPDVAVAAAKRYLADYLGWDEKRVRRISQQALKKAMDAREDQDLFKSVKAIVEAEDESVRLEKVGFARSVIGVVEAERGPAGVEELEARMEKLLGRLNTMARQAQSERFKRRIENRVRLKKDQFLDDFPGRATKDDAARLFAEIGEAVDDSLEGQAVRKRLQRLTKEHSLEDDGTNLDVEDYEQFKEDLESVQYAGLAAVQTND